MRQPGFLSRPGLFWAGIVMTALGVGEHLRMLVQMAPMHFRMAGMPMSPTMWVAMVMIAAGVVLAGVALVPRDAPPPSPSPTPSPALHRELGSRQRRRLVAILALAMLLDQMKPATIAFIEPGMADEYEISSGQVAWMPAAALAGTVLGALMLGRAADRVGRRAAILTGAILFLGTTVCGAMTSFAGNVVMCALMGVAAGGMLPVVYTLMAETLPRRTRSTYMILLGGLATSGGYLLTAAVASVMIPAVGWRLMWFAQLPLVLVLICCNHWIPETRGRHESRTSSSAAMLMRPPYRRATLLVGVYALAWGLVYWGFVSFLPTILDDGGLRGLSSAVLLTLSSALSVPTCLLACWLYRRWSAHGAMTVYGAVSVLGLVLFAAVGVSDKPAVTVLAIALLLTGCSGVVALLGPYTAESYPSGARGTASGVVAALSKLGGVFGPPLVALGLQLPEGARVTALLVAIPMAAGAMLVARPGPGVLASAEQPRMAGEPEHVQ